MDGTRTILVIAEECFSAQIVRCLERRAYKTLATDLASQGLEWVRSNVNISLVVTYADGPADRDGWQILRTIKADPVTRDMPVIMLSSDDQAHRAWAAGADCVLDLPLDLRMLDVFIQRILYPGTAHRW